MSNHIAIFLSGIIHTLKLLVQSAWRPLHRTSAKHMKMQVLDRLTALVASIGYHAEALVQLVLLSKLRNDLAHDMPHQLLVGRRKSAHALKMLLGYYQSVERCLWLQILEGQYLFILIDYRGRNLLGCDFAKNTI